MPTEEIINCLHSNSKNPNIIADILHYIMSIAASFQLAIDEDRIPFENVSL
jgi:hypothetical protein